MKVLNYVSLLQFLLQSTKMMESFMRLAKSNTAKNLETCGVLAGSLVCFATSMTCTFLQLLALLAVNL